MEGFCYSRDMLVDVVDDTALALEFPVDRLFEGVGLLEFIAEIVVGFLETLAMTTAVAEGFTGDEAEGGGQHHPYR